MRYCEGCRDCPILIDEDIKIVPRNYQPNSADTKVSGLAKIEDHTRDLMNRMNIPLSSSNIRDLVETVFEMHQKRGKRCKGYREETAAVLYVNYEKWHKLTIRRFCQKNGIEVKKFNKMYILYKNQERERERE